MVSANQPKHRKRGLNILWVQNHLVPEVLSAQWVAVYHAYGHFTVSSHHVLYQLCAPPASYIIYNTYLL